jgi:CubicO group peptidase (beta-lactamase class C family)
MAKSWIELGLMIGSPPPADKIVTLSNYDKAPFPRWSMINMRELMPSTSVKRGDVTTPLARNHRDFNSFSFELDGVQYDLNAVLDKTYVDALMIVHNDEVVFEHFEDGVYSDSRHIAQSVTKSFVATVAGILIGRGEFDASKYVTDYLPELVGTNWDECTVQALLDMRAGTAFDESDYEDIDSEALRGFRILGWLPRHPDDPTPQEYIAGLNNIREHGTIFEYRSILTDVLGWCLERATDTTLADLISQEIWIPMGAEYDADLLMGPVRFPTASGGLCLTISDLARFGLMHLHRGKVGDRQVVPQEWVDSITQDADGLVTAYRASMGPSDVEEFYHNQWWVLDGQRGIYSGLGIHGQQVLIHPESNTVIAKFSSWPRPRADEFELLSDACMLALCDYLGSSSSSP